MSVFLAEDHKECFGLADSVDADLRNCGYKILVELLGVRESRKGTLLGQAVSYSSRSQDQWRELGTQEMVTKRTKASLH